MARSSTDYPDIVQRITVSYKEPGLLLVSSDGAHFLKWRWQRTSAACPLSLATYDVVCNLVWPHRGPCFKQEVGLADLLRCLPTWIILWSCGFIDHIVVSLHSFSSSILKNPNELSCSLYRNRPILWGFFALLQSYSVLLSETENQKHSQHSRWKWWHRFLQCLHHVPWSLFLSLHLIYFFDQHCILRLCFHRAFYETITSRCHSCVVIA